MMVGSFRVEVGLKCEVVCLGIIYWEGVIWVKVRRGDVVNYVVMRVGVGVRIF